MSNVPQSGPSTPANEQDKSKVAPAATPAVQTPASQPAKTEEKKAM